MKFRMECSFSEDGLLTVTDCGTVLIEPSPLGMITVAGNMYAPVICKQTDDILLLSYPSGEQVRLTYRFRENGTLRLEVLEIDDRIDGFTFGPFVCPETVACGEIVGAAYRADGICVCIQSLNPKTVGEIPFGFVNRSKYPSPCPAAAGIVGGVAVLSCSTENMTRPKCVEVIESGLQNVTALPVEGADGSIVGSAIALLAAKNRQQLLDDIGCLELEEGLPHPTIDGVWAKINPEASDIYFTFGNGDLDEQMTCAREAGVRYLYYGDPFKSWGTFEPDPEQYPGGRTEFVKRMQKACDNGLGVGFHTLSNFIQTNDPYVTPVPHKELLDYDPTPLILDIDDEQTEIVIGDLLNYGRKTSLDTVRIGNELIRYGEFDAEKLTLLHCRRGAFGTKAVRHCAGETVTRMADHGYGTLFPNIRLQKEIAGNIGRLVRDAHITRMSFDGLEGCSYTGRGEYAQSVFVKELLDVAGSELICDASTCSHYRWHAHSYFNHGEPWYDSDRRGGMYNYRIQKQQIWKNNLLPGMLGWFTLWDTKGAIEPTLPETLEFILSRTVAYDAGLTFTLDADKRQKTHTYLKLIRLWRELRMSRIVLDGELLKCLRDKHSDWHLESSAGKWLLKQIELERQDLSCTQQCVITESGKVGYGDLAEAKESDGEEQLQRSNVCWDRSSDDPADVNINEPLHFRVRVGTPLEKGYIHGFSVFRGHFSTQKYIGFEVRAEAGDYLEYCGGNVLRHYDRNYDLLETIEGEGEPIVYDGSRITYYTFDYFMKGQLTMMLTQIRTVRVYEIDK